MKLNILFIFIIIITLKRSDNWACDESEHRCNHTSTCVHKEWFCDGIKDCFFGEDEEIGCVQCKETEFRCGIEKRCYPRSKFCNGFKDCKDFSDEFYCITFKNNFVIANHFGEADFHICSTHWEDEHSDDVCKFFKDRLVYQTSFEVVRDAKLKFIKLINPGIFKYRIPEMSYFEKSKNCESNKFVKVVCQDIYADSLTNERCGTRGNTEGFGEYVTRGHEASYGGHPWHVQIFAGQLYICGGTLTSRRFVLTAAHCVYNRDAKDLKVMIGPIFQNDRTKRMFNITHVIMHPLSRPKDFNNDVAMLMIQDTLRYSKSIKPVCLPTYYEPTRPSMMDSYRYCVLIGFGALSESIQKPQTRMYQSRMDLMNDTECARTLTRIAKNSGHSHYQNLLAKNHLMCAGSNPTENGSNACWYDDGSPLVCRELLGQFTQLGIAIVDLHDPEIKNCSVSVFIRTDAYIDFISGVNTDVNRYLPKSRGTIQKIFGIFTSFDCLIAIWMPTEIFNRMPI